MTPHTRVSTNPYTPQPHRHTRTRYSYVVRVTKVLDNDIPVLHGTWAGHRPNNRTPNSPPSIKPVPSTAAPPRRPHAHPTHLTPPTPLHPTHPRVPRRHSELVKPRSEQRALREHLRLARQQQIRHPPPRCAWRPILVVAASALRSVCHEGRRP